MIRARAAGPLVVLAISLAACGDDGGATTAPTTTADVQRLTAADRALIERSEDAIAAYCRRFSLFALQQADAPPPAVESRAFTAAERLAALEEVKPRAPISEAEDLHLHVSDVIENLEAINCDERLVELFEQILSG